MVLNLKRWVEFIEDEYESIVIPKGQFNDYTIRLDRIDGFSVEDEELVLVIGGNEYFFEYDKKEYTKLVNYFNNISNFRFN